MLEFFATLFDVSYVEQWLWCFGLVVFGLNVISSFKQKRLRYGPLSILIAGEFVALGYDRFHLTHLNLGGFDYHARLAGEGFCVLLAVLLAGSILLVAPALRKKALAFWMGVYALFSFWLPEVGFDPDGSNLSFVFWLVVTVLPITAIILSAFELNKGKKSQPAPIETESSIQKPTPRKEFPYQGVGDGRLMASRAWGSSQRTEDNYVLLPRSIGGRFQRTVTTNGQGFGGGRHSTIHNPRLRFF